MEIVAPDARNLETRFYVNGCKFKPPFLWTPGGQISVDSEAFLCHLLKGQHLWKGIHIGGRILPQTFVWCNFSAFASFLYIMKTKHTYLECDYPRLVRAQHEGTRKVFSKCICPREMIYLAAPRILPWIHLF